MCFFKQSVIHLSIEVELISVFLSEKTPLTIGPYWSFLFPVMSDLKEQIRHVKCRIVFWGGSIFDDSLNECSTKRAEFF